MPWRFNQSSGSIFDFDLSAEPLPVPVPVPVPCPAWLTSFPGSEAGVAGAGAAEVAGVAVVGSALVGVAEVAGAEAGSTGVVESGAGTKSTSELDGVPLPCLSPVCPLGSDCDPSNPSPASAA